MLKAELSCEGHTLTYLARMQDTYLLILILVFSNSAVKKYSKIDFF